MIKCPLCTSEKTIPLYVAFLDGTERMKCGECGVVFDVKNGNRILCSGDEVESGKSAVQYGRPSVATDALILPEPTEEEIFNFKKNLEYARKEVETWPRWKQEALGIVVKNEKPSPEHNGNCMICGVPIHVQMCCDGRECGCMGQPVEPPLCSSERCWNVFEEIQTLNREKRDLEAVVKNINEVRDKQEEIIDELKYALSAKNSMIAGLRSENGKLANMVKYLEGELKKKGANNVKPHGYCATSYPEDIKCKECQHGTYINKTQKNGIVIEIWHCKNPSLIPKSRVSGSYRVGKNGTCDSAEERRKW